MNNVIVGRADLQKEFQSLPLVAIQLNHLEPKLLATWGDHDVTFVDRNNARKPLTGKLGPPSVGELWLCQVPPDEAPESAVWRWIPRDRGGAFEVRLTRVEREVGMVSGLLNDTSRCPGALFPATWLCHKIQ
jgi:hypothetical protein